MPSHREKSQRLVRSFQITDGQDFSLKQIDPADTGGIESKKRAAKLLDQGIVRLRDLQEKLYAQGTWAILVIFQAMDAAGKDSTITHVMSGLNPQGCEVHSFKAPGPEELAHDYLWRTIRRLPGRGRIGIFNRSHYEEVLVVRVHPHLLAAEHIPPPLVSPRIWRERFDDINEFEAYLRHNGVVVCKFFLHVSKAQQRQRFLQRLERPEKQWKFSMADVEERAYWNDYMEAYEDMVRHTATNAAPWHVVPADHKWFTHLVVAAALADRIEALALTFPHVDRARRQELEAAREALERERE
jgi:PPK2 family polyphosphate:nucleotide phosphotransferase